MSYVCPLCIASRLDEIRGLNDVLCDACVSKVRPETNYVHSYFARINREVYRELISNALKKRLEAHVRAATHVHSYQSIMHASLPTFPWHLSLCLRKIFFHQGVEAISQYLLEVGLRVV